VVARPKSTGSTYGGISIELPGACIEIHGVDPVSLGSVLECLAP